MQRAGQTLGISTDGNLTTLTLEHTEHLRAHVDAMKREIDSQKQKPHKTIFGKLFNYS
jgi:hypothetical protein